MHQQNRNLLVANTWYYIIFCELLGIYKTIVKSKKIDSWIASSRVHEKCTTYTSYISTWHHYTLQWVAHTNILLNKWIGSWPSRIFRVQFGIKYLVGIEDQPTSSEYNCLIYILRESCGNTTVSF